MTIKVSKPEINIREKLNDLDFDKLPFQKMPAGSVLQVVTTNLIGTDGTPAAWSTVTETVAYNNNSITPLLQVTINPRQSGSHFLVSLSGNFQINSGYRSQILLSSDWVAGAAPYNNSTYIWYSHYGLYNNTGGDAYRPGAYSHYDANQNASSGEDITYSWFGGSIGGTQRYEALSMTVMEIAQ
jgi:hypothetical protein